ncbi:MAG: TonB-dependent receptor plug domain-containing protein [Bacteroidales bacterium]|nr:TonB-dependent receptor plug domain-containing protein [Bacteroidales bacterium]
MGKICYLTLLAALTLAFGCASSRGTSSPVFNDEPVNIGYGQVSQDDLTYSVSHKKEKHPRTFNTVYDYLREMVPGVRVESTGPLTANVYVRGINSINSGTSPLFVVDGVVIDDISSINPYEIDSVDVLKDSASAIYGVRGANGVILITLKKPTK